MDINGIAAVVSGGASRLGRATAVKLVAAGAKVALFDRNIELAEKTAAEIGAEIGAEMGVVRIVDRQHRPMELDHFRNIIEVNLIGTFNTLRLAAAGMSKLDPRNEEGSRGAIVNTASVAGYEGQVGQAAYASSKGGITGLTICSARDLSSWGIRVNTIAPGIMLTPLLSGLPDETLELLGKQVPFPKRTGHAEEYASMAMELVRNEYMNGETVRCDGAIRMAPR